MEYSHSHLKKYVINETSILGGDLNTVAKIHVR